ncbi:DUF7322 domain-containing protein [Halobaculum limi]|uniref:DUF7322 domain-containing protein n=1 Tax=Halobaculum limi TaxID=3031916 RepID=UPI0024064322|nr:hypothetical protein [Halobaculum sp. YSMS11]
MLEDDDDGDLFGLEREASEAENRGPRVNIPTVNDPSDSLPDPSTVDPHISRSFMTAVLYANVAVLGVSLGAMLIGFRGQWNWGGFAIVVGLLAGVRVYQTYRAFEQWREERDADEATEDDDTETDPDEASDAERDVQTYAETDGETEPDDPTESQQNTPTEDD